MSTGPMNSVIERLRRAVRRDGAGPGDGELLGRFIERHDEAALAALVERHGPMVWGVCRRLLTHHDAEDAFQATFLVLVRKAAAIVPRELVGNWLYGVAHRTALLARRTAARRRAREVQVTVMPDPETGPPSQWPDLAALLDRELSRLPDRYRAVVVLCELEGRTRKEVARQLGIPEGTVAGRLARARARLAKRLSDRFVTVTGGALAAVLGRSAASAGPPDALVSSTIRLARFWAAGPVAVTGPVSAEVAALSHGVMKAMLLSKLKTGAAAILVLGLICAAGLGLHRPARGEPAPGTREPTDTVKADLAAQFKHRVPFEIGLTETNEGGRIEIQEVRGTRPKIEVGGYYLVHGKYVLPAGQRGALYFFATAGGEWGHVGTIMDLQHTVLDKEKGEFTLMHGMAGPGYFHLYLASPDRYSRMFANVYFGTGDNVWRKKN